MPDPLRLFLIENDEDIMLLVRKSLERAGHRVVTCHSAADALIVLGQRRFDLVLLDHKLPDMRGLDLLEALSRRGAAPAALVVTSQGDEVTAAQYLRTGVLDYVKIKDGDLTFLTELPKRVHEAVTRHRLQECNRLFTQALESARDGVLITDLTGQLLHVNRALERITGYLRPELLGQTPRLFEEDDSPGSFAAALEAVRADGGWQGEVICHRKDGTLLDASLAVSPVVDGRGQVTHFVGIYRDLGERKQLERQLLQAQKMQSVGTLAGGVAHEFNNLLAGIQGYASLGLREPRLSEPAREFFGFIVNLSERAALLTRQLLAFARKPALSRQATRMDQLVAATADLVRHSLAVEIVLDLEPEATDGEPLSAHADFNQLQQVLVNLALNARDATQPSAPITFRLRQAVLAGDLAAFPENVPPGDYVVVEVADRGSGMAPEVLSQALDPFFTTKEVGHGTGLGLPVALGIVHGHQGFLTITTAPGSGTCVAIYLPRLAGQAPNSVPANTAASRAHEPASVPTRDILVIDDEQAVLDVVRRFLAIAGHRVKCAISGSEALAVLGTGRPIDLVILDLMIPHEEGNTTFELLRRQRPGLPMLLCTGLLQTDPAPALLRAERVYLLRKPFHMNELWDAVNQALAAKAA